MAFPYSAGGSKRSPKAISLYSRSQSTNGPKGVILSHPVQLPRTQYFLVYAYSGLRERPKTNKSGLIGHLKTPYLRGTEKSIQSLALAPFIRNIGSEAGVELGGTLKNHGGCLILT